MATPSSPSVSSFTTPVPPLPHPAGTTTTNKHGSSISTFHNSAKEGFGSNVIHAYEHGRPEHPIEGVRYLLEAIQVIPSSSSLSVSSSSSSSRTESSTTPTSSSSSTTDKFPFRPIVEIGCGTGKYTRPLYSILQSYCTNTHPLPNLICVDPADMASKINEDFPSIPFIKSTADALPSIPDHTVGHIIIAQAFHWMANRATMNELYRILHPSGTIALVWNMRYIANEITDQWIHRFENLLNEYYEPSTPRQINGEWKRFLEQECTDLFQFPMESHFLVHDYGGYNGTEEQVLNYALSISDISKRSTEEKGIIKERFRHLLHETTTPYSVREQDGEKLWKIPMRIEMYWFRPKK